MRPNNTWIFLLLVALGVILRLGFVLAADSRQSTFLSGGSDAPVYVLLAENIVSHKGFSYAGQPSAFRPPGYPLLIAGFMEVFGQHYITAIRCLQFIVGLFTVGICAKISLRIFDPEAERATILFGLFLPTLVFSIAQLLTECVSAFLTALFLLFLVDQMEKADPRSAIGLGLASGLESLIRFNAAAMPFFAAWAVAQSRRKDTIFLRGAIVLLLPCLVVLPWITRNASVFPGHVLYSTHGGANAVQGVISTQGRTQLGDTQKLMAAMGWQIYDLETNDPSRLSMPSEVELNRKAMAVVPQLWKQQGWHAVPLLAGKVADFWFSSDQLLDTKSLPLRDRAIRTGGVLSYLIVLAFAAGGLYHLRKIRPELALLLFFYAVGYTVFHLPFVMNTRLRIPLMEPLILVLAGAGWSRLSFLLWHNRDANPPSAAMV